MGELLPDMDFRTMTLHLADQAVVMQDGAKTSRVWRQVGDAIVRVNTDRRFSTSEFETLVEFVANFGAVLASALKK